MSRKVNFLKIIFALASASYIAYIGFNPDKWNILSGVNLVFHEAGHVLFYVFAFFPFGNFLIAAGGTITQLALFAIISFDFYRTRQYYSASISLFLLSQSFFNVAIYAGDAIVMQLPLLGGGGEHDWNYMLSILHILPYAVQIGNMFWAMGILTFLAATFFSIKHSIKYEEKIPKTLFSSK